MQPNAARPSAGAVVSGTRQSLRHDLLVWQELMRYYQREGCLQPAKLAEKQVQRIVEKRARQVLSRCRGGWS